jgi:hypothetical protein
MKACIELPRFSYPDADAFFLERLLNLLADANAAWYLEQWADGRDPPCCAGCTEIRWTEPRKSAEQTFHAAPTLIAAPRKGWSCGEIAAMDAGAKKAKSIRDGGTGEEITVVLQHVGDRRWHAVVRTPKGLRDPSRDQDAREGYAIGAQGIASIAYRPLEAVR